MKITLKKKIDYIEAGRESSKSSDHLFFTHTTVYILVVQNIFMMYTISTTFEKKNYSKMEITITMNKRHQKQLETHIDKVAMLTLHECAESYKKQCRYRGWKWSIKECYPFMLFRTRNNCSWYEISKFIHLFSSHYPLLYPNVHTVRRRILELSNAGVFIQAIQKMSEKIRHILKSITSTKKRTVHIIDSTHIKNRRGREGFGRCSTDRGRNGTKGCLIIEAGTCLPIQWSITPSNVSDGQCAIDMHQAEKRGLFVPEKRKGSNPKSRRHVAMGCGIMKNVRNGTILLADKAYDWNHLRWLLRQYGYVTHIPRRRNVKKVAISV